MFHYPYKIAIKIAGISAALLIGASLSGCGSSAVAYPYSEAASLSVYGISPAEDASRGDLFARDLAVTENSRGSMSFETEAERAAGLYDVTAGDTVYSKDVFVQLYPASTTKVMTALLALEHADLDDKITASGTAAGITESGATLLGLKAGDTLTMDQALNALLIYSANDVAIAIAEHVAGSVAQFADMMNEEAHRLGATGTHFVNPHGLHEENHYTTAYDMYLMFNEAIKYERFVEIISSTEYNSVYYDRDGAEKKIELKSTNNFLNGAATPPEDISVIGGKTGTTKAAGSNLVLLSEDSSGTRYISVILHDDSRDLLYTDMSTMLAGVGKG